MFKEINWGRISKKIFFLIKIRSGEFFLGFFFYKIKKIFNSIYKQPNYIRSKKNYFCNFMHFLKKVFIYCFFNKKFLNKEIKKVKKYRSNFCVSL